MIPAIGYMIGFYILTRMLSLLGHSDVREMSGCQVKSTPSECLGARIMAVVTIVITVLMMLILFSAEMDIGGIMRNTN